MRLEPANIVCPKCGNGNYMRHMIGKNVGKLDMKCINCNSYFSFNELYKQKIAEVIKPKTNADRIRAMTVTEMAEFMAKHNACLRPKRTNGECEEYYDCKYCWLDWLKQEATE